MNENKYLLKIATSPYIENATSVFWTLFDSPQQYHHKNQKYNEVTAFIVTKYDILFDHKFITNITQRHFHKLSNNDIKETNIRNRHDLLIKQKLYNKIKLMGMIDIINVIKLLINNKAKALINNISMFNELSKHILSNPNNKNMLMVHINKVPLNQSQLISMIGKATDGYITTNKFIQFSEEILNETNRCTN